MKRRSSARPTLGAKHHDLGLESVTHCTKAVLTHGFCKAGEITLEDGCILRGSWCDGRDREKSRERKGEQKGKKRAGERKKIKGQQGLSGVGILSAGVQRSDVESDTEDIEDRRCVVSGQRHRYAVASK